MYIIIFAIGQCVYMYIVYIYMNVIIIHAHVLYILYVRNVMQQYFRVQRLPDELRYN